MNRAQQRLISVYIPATVIIVILDLVLDGTRLLWLAKYLVVFSLFLTTFLYRKKTRDQERLGISLFFVAAGDAFLYLPLAMGYAQSDFIPYGIMMFILAYGCLILVYRKKLRPGRFEIMAAIACAAMFYAGVTVLWRTGTGPVINLALLFWGILCTMFWTALCTLSQRSPFEAYGRAIALSAVLMVICDVGVALGLFYPPPHPVIYDLAESVIWAAYVPAWTLVAWLTVEGRPLTIRIIRNAASQKTTDVPGVSDHMAKGDPHGKA